MSVSTPCKNICKMDDDNRFCIGCYRTKNEITNWGIYNNASRKKITSELSERVSEIRKIGYYGDSDNQ